VSIYRSHRTEQAVRGIRGAVKIVADAVLPAGTAATLSDYEVAQFRGAELLLVNQSGRRVSLQLKHARLWWPRRVQLVPAHGPWVLDPDKSQHAAFGLRSTRLWADDPPDEGMFYKRRCFLSATFVQLHNRERVRFRGWIRMYRPPYKR